MVKFFKNYWDILAGASTGLLLSFLAGFQLEPIQLIYSVIILILVCIGVFKVIRQAVEKHKQQRNTLLDTLVDGQKPIKAISIATNPTREGETLGKLILESSRGVKFVMKKLKVYFDKFKGFLLAICLTILTIVEYCGGFINELFNDKLSVSGIDIIPLVTLVCAVVVGCISNGFTKEQVTKIKALFDKSSTNELVVVEIKKTLKEAKSKLVEFNKLKSTQETALENLKQQEINAENTLKAKRQMYDMTPRLATEEDIRLANANLVECRESLIAKQKELDTTIASIDNLTVTINALQEQL